MKPASPDPLLSPVEGRLRCYMVPHNDRVKFMLPLVEVHDVQKIAFLWGCRDAILGMCRTGSDGNVWEIALHQF